MNKPSEQNRPVWTIRANTQVVWSEDDVTVSHPDHESLEMAYLRIYETSKVPTPVASWEDEESCFKLLPSGTVLVASFPGNTEIRELLVVGQLDPPTMFPMQVRVLDDEPEPLHNISADPRIAEYLRKVSRDLMSEDPHPPGSK